MSLSARTDDNTGGPIGEGYITLSTSAGNMLVFSDPSSANIYLQANPGQFNKGNGIADGDFNDEYQHPV